jgi:hypothetical protein
MGLTLAPLFTVTSLVKTPDKPFEWQSQRHAAGSSSERQRETIPLLVLKPLGGADSAENRPCPDYLMFSSLISAETWILLAISISDWAFAGWPSLR